MKYYIVGYGSLICEKSRSKTGDFGKEYKIKILGYKRSWNIHAKHKLNFNATFLGINKDKDYWFNAVIFEVKFEDILKFDKREIPYNRIELNKEEYEFYDEKLNLNSEKFKIFMYLNKKDYEGFPSEEYQISEIYIDSCLIGCLRFSKEFAEDFIKTTNLWGNNIKKNRQDLKKYLNFENMDLEKVDKLLLKLK